MRNCQTDYDGDGFSDCAEFIAGTNPTLASSYLRLPPPTVLAGINKLVFQWQTVPGRIYQLQGYNFEAQMWVPSHSGWLQATGGTLSKTISAPDQTEPYLFRLEVRP